MKPAKHNEVDLLLRSLARDRKAAAWRNAPYAGERTSSAHLDADELNSYAEGVAPATSRARYTEHLADCEACRRIVVGLSQAAGVTKRFEGPEEKGGASFWQKLAVLFSPPVLRFAVPALVLSVIVGIGLLALRRPAADQLVARNEPPTIALPLAQKEIAEAPNQAAPATPQASTGNELHTKGESPADKPILFDDKTKVAEPASSASKAGLKDSAQTVDGASVAQPQPYAYEPKPPAPPPAKMMEAEKSTELAKEQTGKREDKARDQDETLRNEPDDVHGPNRSRSNSAPMATQRGAGLMAGRGPSGMDKSKKAAEEVETRTVMGRHFNREGDTWVDIAYDSSRAAIRVTRGSDQFRALIADEPAIRTIAEQLNGIVIVVWKSRAYRIQ